MDAVLLGHVWDQLEEHCHCQHVIYWIRYLNYVFSALRTNQILRVESMWREPKKKRKSGVKWFEQHHRLERFAWKQLALSHSLSIPRHFFHAQKKMGTSKHNVCNIREGLMCSQRSYILLNMDRNSISHICVKDTQTRLAHASTPTCRNIATASAAASVMYSMRR